MKVNLSFVVSDARGRLDDKVYARNQGGAYARQFANPPYSNTSYQSAVRNEFKRLSQKWATLTEAERLSWESGRVNFPRTNVFGDKKVLDAKALYQSLNMNLFLIGKTDRVNCPAPVFIPTPIISYLNQHPPQYLRLYTSRPPGTSLLIEGTPQLSPAINFFKKYYKLFMVSKSTDVNDPPLSAKYLARFGSFVDGAMMAIKIQAVNESTGQRSATAMINQIVHL